MKLTHVRKKNRKPVLLSSPHNTSSSAINDAPLAQMNHKHSRIINKIDSKSSTVIIAGHYCLAEHMQELSSTGDAESQGFELGVQLLVRALEKNIKHNLVVWINDIGINKQQRAMNKEKFSLPDNYLKILKEYGLDASHVTIMFESCMRNKASTLVKKILKQQPGRLRVVNADDAELVRCVQNSACDSAMQAKNHAYVIAGPDNEQLVIKEGPAPKCNLILATFFNELANKYYPQHFVNIFNDVYAYRLRLGVHVANNLLNNTVSMTNVLCDGEQIRCESF